MSHLPFSGRSTVKAQQITSCETRILISHVSTTTWLDAFLRRSQRVAYAGAAKRVWFADERYCIRDDSAMFPHHIPKALCEAARGPSLRRRVQNRMYRPVDFYFCYFRNSRSLMTHRPILDQTIPRPASRPYCSSDNPASQRSPTLVQLRVYGIWISLFILKSWQTWQILSQSFAPGRERVGWSS